MAYFKSIFILQYKISSLNLSVFLFSVFWVSGFLDWLGWLGWLENYTKFYTSKHKFLNLALQISKNTKNNMQKFT